MTMLGGAENASEGVSGAIVDHDRRPKFGDKTNLRSFVTIDVRTEHQLRPHEGFTPEALDTRGPGIRSEGGRTAQLAAPPSWSQTAELTPCQRDLEFLGKSEWAYKWDPDTWSGVQQKRANAQAEANCADCPVRGECLADALAEEGTLHFRGRHFVRGGMTPRGRWLLAAGKKVPEPEGP